MISFVLGEIQDAHADAIVNSAHPSLLGGGGVDGALHLAAGPELLRECRELKGCETGHAKITGAGKLRADYVIHTVGPVWQGGDHGEMGQLARCHIEVVLLALDHDCHTIAVPAISTGIHGFPLHYAADIALTSTRRALTDVGIDVTFWLHDSEAFRAYAR